MIILGLDPFAWALLTLFLGIAPWLSRAHIASLRRSVANGDPNARQATYRTEIIIQWSVTIFLLGAWLILGRGFEELGLVLRVSGWQWLAIFVSLAALGVFSWQIKRAIDDPKQLRCLRDQLGRLEVFIPHNEDELRGFSWLSITAGICEEILYRGLLMVSLTATLGLWPAVALSSVVFGIGHSYQGPKGMLRTGLVGLVLAIIVVTTGSLFVAMLIHALLDLTQGRMLLAAVNIADDGGEQAPTFGLQQG